MDRLRNAAYEELITIDAVGERIAGSVVEYFSKPENNQLIDRLQDAGVNMVQAQTSDPSRWQAKHL